MAQLYDANGNPFLTDVVVSGTPGAANATVTATLRGQACATVQVTAIGTLTLTFEGSTDGVNFNPLLATPIAGGAPVSTTTANGQWVNISTAGLAIFRVRVSAYTSGTATVTVIASQGAAEPNYTTGGIPKVDVASVNGTALGTPTNFGTSPGAVVAESANASLFVGTTAVTAAIAGSPDVNAKGWGGTALGTPTAFGTTPGAVVAASVNSSAFVGTVAAVAASAGVQKVGVSGNAGAALDGAIAAVPPANAVQIGIKAATANPTNATAGNAVAIMGDKAGRQVVTPGNVRELIGVQTTTIANSAAETTIVTAGAAGVFNDISHIDFIMTNAGTPAACTVTLKDATAGTTRAVYFLGATAATFVDEVSLDFPIPMPQSGAAANWTITLSSATVTVNVNVVYVKNL